MEDFGYKRDENQGDSSKLNRQILLALATILSISIFVYITITAYHFVYQDDENIEIIKGPDFPIKIIIDDENSKENVKIDRAIYEDIFGNRKSNIKEENAKIINTPESPLPPKKDLNNKTISNPAINSEEKIDDSTSPKSLTVDPLSKNNYSYQSPQNPVIADNQINDNQKINDELDIKDNSQNNQQVIIKKKLVRVQIAAMSSQDQADQQWKKLLRTHPNLFINLRSIIQKADLGKRGIFYRLQIGEFFNQIEAENFCQRYISQAQKTRADCIVVE